MEMMKSHYFCIFMYIWWFLNLWLFFFVVESLPCRLARNLQALSTKKQNFNKTAAFSHHCPLWHEHSHWGIGIPGYAFRSAIQAWAIGYPTTFLGFCYPGEYTQLIVFNGRPRLQLYIKGLSSLFMMKFWDDSKKSLFIWLPLTNEPGRLIGILQLWLG